MVAVHFATIPCDPKTANRYIHKKSDHMTRRGPARLTAKLYIKFRMRAVRDGVRERKKVVRPAKVAHGPAR